MPRPRDGSRGEETNLKEFGRWLVLSTAVAVCWPIASRAEDPSAHAAVVNKYCVTCHSDKMRTGGLSLQGADLTDVPRNAENWEKVIRKLRTGSMPPQGMPRPEQSAIDGLASYLEVSLDRAAAAKPNPGHAAMHRLNRAEYANAIRDLLALDIDSTALLPPDDGLAAASTISRMCFRHVAVTDGAISIGVVEYQCREAVGDMNIAPATAARIVFGLTFRRDQHIEGLPLGTRWPGAISCIITSRWMPSTS